MVNRDIPLLKIFLALLITTFLFLIGILIGYSISYYKYQDLYLKQESIKYDLLNIELESNFLDTCDSIVLEGITSELSRMGQTIELLEERFGKNDIKVIDQKKKYSLLEVQHLLSISEFEKKCNANLSIILFFYSNKKDYVDAAQKIGFILSSLKNENPEKIMIYSFDFDIDSSIITILKRYYHVEVPNTVIIENKTIVGIDNINDIKQYIIS